MEPVQILQSRPYSDHPGDQYLEVVLAINENREYVTWIKNSSYEGEPAFVEGYYFGNNYDVALHDYETRR